ncbi:MAG: hypothetical protein ACLRYB_01020 [Segatella copri]
MAMLTTVFVGCKSKAEKAIEEMRGITQQFIVDMNNAQSKEEALQILKAYEERGKYEEMKLSEEDKKNISKNQIGKTFKRIKDSKKKLNRL